MADVPKPQLIVDRELARQTFGPYEREIAPPPIRTDEALILAAIRDAHEHIDRMQERLERAMQAKQQQDGNL